MEAQRLPCPPVSLNDQPIQLASCLQAIPAASDLSPNPVVLQPEQALSQTIYVKALTIPLYPPIRSECLHPNSKLLPNQTSINLDSTTLPLILSPLLQSEGMDPLRTVIQKQPGTVSIVSGLPVFPQNSSPCSPLGSPSKCKNVGKCICKHCGRDCLKPSVLEKHIRSHTGERPFPCTTCGIAFKTQSNLYKHKRTQTHVNNARLSSESDSSSLLEESEKVTESIASPQKTKASDKYCDHQRATVKHAALVTNEKHHLDSSSPAVNAVFLVSGNQWMAIDSSSHGGADRNVKETMKDSVNPLQRRKIQEQRSPTISKPSQLQRQQATYSEKLWDSRSPDYKLKKCESTDSGYFSRSDSVEQQMLSPSPLHSLCEHSTEAEGDTAINNLRCIAGNASKVDGTEKATGTVTLEKKKLEEHISKLISHNKAVVDDTQLDNVRPRKTVLSKQGSIDLPMPYTYKDSFHFDLRPLDINRKKKLSQCSAKSTFTPVERSKPLFFHSVPTQFSTTIDCVPVTRSNSMPFMESTRRVQDHVDILKVPSSTSTSPDTSFSGLLPGKNFAASVIDFPTNHPRALVRQTAVDYLALSNVNESSPSLEEIKNAKKVAASGEGANSKYKKPSQRKLKMFSQEKWQVYGDETFKKIYQKMKSSQTTKKLKGNEVTDISTPLSDGNETVGCDGVPLPRDGRNSKTGNMLSSTMAVNAQLNLKESETYSVSSPVSQDVSSQESLSNLAEFMETSCAVNDGQHAETTKTFVVHRCTELCVSKEDLSSNSQIVPLSASCESSFQLQQPTGQKTNAQSNLTSLHNSGLKEMHTQEETIKCVLHDTVSTSEGDGTLEKERFQLTQGVLLSNQCNSEPGQEPQKVPSERKKLKVDKLKSKENFTVKSSLCPNTSTEGIVKMLDDHKLDVVLTEAAHSLVTGEEKKVMAGRNISGSLRECEDAIRYPKMTSSNKNYVADITHISTITTLEQHRTEVTNEYTYNLDALQRLTKQPCPIITKAGVLSKTGDMAQTPAPTQHLIFDQVTPCLKKNDFLPKYILKYSQEIDNSGMPLMLAESEKMSCISLPGTSNCSPFSPSNNRCVSTNATDVFLCPLQLEVSHPGKTKESKWDMQTLWKPLVVCPTTVLETTRIDGRCHLQNIRQKETVTDVRSAHNKGNLGDETLTQEVDGHTIVCTSLTLGKKICFTTVYAGGFFISSDKSGQNSAVKLIHSGNSSVISVSSLVERTVLCGNTEKIKEWQPDIDTFPRLQDLPSCSAHDPECLCHSSSMLYCHVLCTQEKAVSTPSQSSAVSQAGNSKVSDMNIAFPTLNAEPQLTWCCLSRNLPLPIEQKGKKDSAYSFLHTCKNENISSKHSHSFCKIETIRKVDSGDRKTGTLKTLIPFVPEEQQTEEVMSLPEGQQTEEVMCLPERQQTEELYPSAAGVDGLFKNKAEQTKAKEKLHKMRDHSRNKAKRSRKRRKVKINQKRSKGNYGHRCTLLKTKQPSKPRWTSARVLEAPSSRSPNSHEHCLKCLCSPAAFQGNDENGENPQEASYVVNEKASSPVKEDKMKEDVPRSASEHGSGNLFLQRISAVPNIPIPKYSCPLASNAPAQKAGHQEICSLETWQKEQQPNMNSDHLWPSVGTCNYEHINTNKSHPYYTMNLQPTDPISLGSKSDCNKVESKHQHFTILEPSVPIMGAREQPTDGDVYLSSKNEHTPSEQSLCSVSLRSRMLTETSVSNKALPKSRHVQETQSSLSCTDKNKYSRKPYSSHEKLLKPENPTFKTSSTCVASLGPQCRSSQSMEMTNKQTYVEYDNTSSSDDEDRLVIEI
ncbi:zinc finger protein 831 [Pogona vitticeps]